MAMKRLYKAASKWLAIQDYQAIDAIMSVAVHAVMPGDPLWLLATNVTL